MGPAYSACESVVRDNDPDRYFAALFDMPAAQRFCDRAVLLERGVVRLVGDPERVANHYVEVNFGRDRLADESVELAAVADRPQS